VGWDAAQFAYLLSIVVLIILSLFDKLAYITSKPPIETMMFQTFMRYKKLDYC
jgi:hypothetical protein